MMKTLKTLLPLAGFLASFLAQADTVSLQDRIRTQEYFKSTYEVIFGKAEYASVPKFHEKLSSLPAKTKSRALALIAALDGVIPEKLLLPLTHWRVIDPNPEHQVIVLTWLGLERVLVLRDWLDHPGLRLTAEQKASIFRRLQAYAGGRPITTLTAFRAASPHIGQQARKLAQLRDDQAFAAAVRGQAELSEPLHTQFPELPDYSNGWLGFIPGNRVELVSDNDRSEARIQWLNDRAIFAGGKLDWSQPYMDIKQHPVFRDPIFHRIEEMVDAATDSIFIDIFLFGGTMGGALSKHVIDRTLEKRKLNPRFRTLLLHDYATNYNMKDEMMPVFEYIRDRIRNEPAVADSVMLMQANIQRHPPGIPFGITNLVPKTDEVFSVIEKRNTYFESKIDHSKVIVIDANTDHPQAYFGSKNWTDHSGAYYYDNALWVAGPAAALVQAAYYDDVAAALTTDPREQKWFFFKEQGFGNEHYLPSRETILDWFRVKKDAFPPAGDQSVRLAEANVDGRIIDARNQLIEMISLAQDHIYMEQLFVYDKYINDALIKRKLQKPSLDIRVLADHNGNFGLNGFPNTIFMKELSDHGIRLRARRTLGIEAQFPDGTKRAFHQENHRKITSVDGRIMMVGSSNQNPDTLQGSFREFGAQVFDTAEIAKYESYFLKDWSDFGQTQEFDIDQFELTLGKDRLPPAVSALINDIGAMILRSKDSLEGRY